MPAHPFPSTTETQTPPARNSEAFDPLSATRSMHAAETSGSHSPLSAQASQESVNSARSVQSGGSSVEAVGLQGSETSLSQLTSYTDISHHSSRRETGPTDQTPRDLRRVKTPTEEGHGFAGNGAVDVGHHMLASPMSVATPVAANGAKRTASGHVKNAPSLPNTPLTAQFNGSARRARAESTSSTTSRAGDLASSLKNRLGYAMAKVQHGWEHRSIVEVEELAANQLSQNRYSMSHLDYSRPMTSGLCNGTSQLSMHDSPRQYPASPPSKRHSAHMGGHFRQKSAAALGSVPHLQPAVDFRPTSSYQTSRGPSPPEYTSQYNHAMSPPRTPVNGRSSRAPTIRTDLQTAEAERDALQALFQLGSPHTSQLSRNAAYSQTPSSQTSPLRTEFATPRKVPYNRGESADSTESSVSNGSLHPHTFGQQAGSTAPVEAYQGH